MVGKLGKLKCLLKRWHSRSRLAAADTSLPRSSSSDDAWQEPFSADGDRPAAAPPGLHPVYVGKSRRRYLISSDLVDHPLFQVLAQRSVDADAVGCEVVLFEHLLWMLENADPPPESIDELVEFYAC